MAEPMKGKPKVVEKPIECDYSIEDLEQFRDEEGFIDLSKAGISLSDESREMGGNQQREKNWVKLNGEMFLIKGEAILDKARNYGIYAELIMEEIGKQLGIKSAHYDLVKFKTKDGREVRGVLSESVLNKEPEGTYMLSLHDIIGDEPPNSKDDFDKTNLEFVLEKMEVNLAANGFDKETIDRVILQFNERLALFIAVIETDNHPENNSFLVGEKDGKKTIELAPIYDSESSFLLDLDEPTVEKMMRGIDIIEDASDFAETRIGIMIPEEEGGFGCYWKDTARMLLDDPEVGDYFFEVIRDKIDMEEIFERVESRIHAPIPENAKLLAKYAFKARHRDMKKIMDYELVPPMEEESYEPLEPEEDPDKMVQALLELARRKAVRETEQQETSKKVDEMLDKKKDSAKDKKDPKDPNKDDHHDLDDD